MTDSPEMKQEQDRIKLESEMTFEDYEGPLLVKEEAIVSGQTHSPPPHYSMVQSSHPPPHYPQMHYPSSHHPQPHYPHPPQSEYNPHVHQNLHLSSHPHAHPHPHPQLQQQHYPSAAIPPPGGGTGGSIPPLVQTGNSPNVGVVTIKPPAGSSDSESHGDNASSVPTSISPHQVCNHNFIVFNHKELEF